MARTHEIRLDRSRPLAEEPNAGHNRWHPEIPPICYVDPGDTVVMEARDAFDGIVTPHTTPDELLRLNFDGVHPLTGPIYVQGAEVGDVLEVKILEVATEVFGFTTISPGFGLLRDRFQKPFVVTWDLSEGIATSPQIRDVRIPGAPFMGVMGVSPSKEMMRAMAAREAELMQRGGLVLLPSASGAVPGREPISSEGLRTIPPRENGGNLDVKQLTAGSTLFLPVFEKGGLFSAGDGHFAQADGESCGTAIETRATLTVCLDLIKGGAKRRKLQTPQYRALRQSVDTSSRFYVTTGLPLTSNGGNEGENVTLAARNAVLSMIDHLVTERDYSPEQAYILASVAADLRISEIVDVPNVVVSAFLPLDIFEN